MTAIPAASALVRTLGTAAIVVLASGCYSPSGGAFPRTGGAYTYYSTSAGPKTVQLVDLRTDEVVFTADIPADRQLTMDILPDEGDDPVYTPDLMRYEVMPIGSRYGKLGNALSVPGPANRRIDVFLRPAPEYAPIPDDEPLRVDELENRPDWWTPEGGPLPEDRRGSRKYDD